MRILVMESSTTSAKAMLYDSEQGVLEVLSEPYSALAGQVDEIGTQDPEGVFLHTISAARRVVKGQQVAAIVPCGTWHNIMVADETFTPITPCYTWTYTGAAAVAGRLRSDEAFCRDYYQRTGCMVHAIYPLFKLLHLKERGFKLEGRQICSQSSYNVYRLTGELVTTDATASGSGLLNVHTRAWDAQALELAGLETGQLPRLTSYRETLPLSKIGSELLGLPAGTPVLPNYPDGALNQVGAGALSPGVMTFSVGTSGALRLSAQRPVLPRKPGTWCYLSPNAWLSGAATSGACNCLDWYKDRLAPPDAPRETLEQTQTDPGSLPFFFPFLFGERCPGWNDGWRGAFLRLSPEHTAADLYRSVQEGILFHLYHCYQILCRENGAPKEIQLSGGITHSRVWRQMCCDIFGHPMVCADVPHASMLGGAVLALETLGAIARIEDFQASPGEILEPDHHMHALYEERFSFYRERCEQNIF